jgi:hypothetical protein
MLFGKVCQHFSRSDNILRAESNRCRPCQILIQFGQFRLLSGTDPATYNLINSLPYNVRPFIPNGEWLGKLDYGELVRLTRTGTVSRLQGVTPAAVSLLLVHLKKRGGKLSARTRQRVFSSLP